VGQLVEDREVVERAVAPRTVGHAHEGRAVGRTERRSRAADGDGALGVAGVHGDLGRRLLDELHEQVARDVHALALDVGTLLLPDRQALGVAEIDADLLEDGERRVVDHL